MHTMRRIRWVAPTLTLLVLLGLAAGLALAATRSTGDDVEARLRALEVAVEQLRAATERPAPPPNTEATDGFVFQRVSVIQQSSSSFAEVVGEVIAPRTVERLRMRATLYGHDGSIVATETFAVNVVEHQARAFDVLMTGIHLTAVRVASVGLQVE